MRGLIHSGRRLDFRNPRFVLLMALSTLATMFFYTYSNESYEYGSQSLKALSEKLDYMQARIDSFKLMADRQAENYVESVTLMEPTATATTAKALATTAHFNQDLQVEEMKQPKENAVLVVFARNMDLYKVLTTMRTVEDRFNKRYNYDWLFLSDTQHSRNFQRMTAALSSGEVKFQTISRKDTLTFPDGIDKKRLKDSRKIMRQKNVSAVKSQRIKHLQRFWTKDIFKIEALKEYDFFMRIEHSSWFHCDIGFDPFRYMRENNKSYGFGFAQRSEVKGFPTLWSSTLKYIEENPKDISPRHLMEFLSDDNGETFNGCQIRSKFEIGDLNFFRSEQYQKFAEHFDQLKGLYYEAWDDSTIRTIGVTLLQDRSRLQFFSNLGFNDNEQKMNLKQCPFDRDVRLKTQCTCNPVDDVTWTEKSCIPKFFEANGFKVPEEVPRRLEHAARVAEERAKADEARKYEEEQLRLEKEKEAEEREKLSQENGEAGEGESDEGGEKPELEEQEGEQIAPGEDTPDVNEDK